MKRIFILNDKVSGGGAEAVMRDIVRYLHDSYEVTVMTLDDDLVSFQNLFPQGVKYLKARIKENPYSRKNPLYYLVALYNCVRVAQIRQKKFDVVIANKEGPCMRLASKMRAEKKLAWVHVDYRYGYWTHWTFPAKKELACMKRYDHVVCVSKAAADSVRQVIGDPGNLCVRYNPIDYRKVLKGAEDAIHVERDASKPLFVAVGRIVEEKNYIALAKVCARLQKEFDFETWIIGDGKQRAAVERILHEENCNCVKLLGRQDNPYPYLAAADCMISTSLAESYGLVIQEALILGIPVLSTKCPAVEECLDPCFGMLVPCEETAIEKGMRYVLQNPKVVRAYRKCISEEYDRESLWLHRLKEIENLI